MSHLLVIPSVSPGGLNAKRSAHFGVCDVFTLLTIQDGKILNTEVVANTRVGDNLCQAPVEMLLQKGVNTLIVNNIGEKPFEQLKAAGAEILLGEGLIIQTAVDNYFAGRLEPLTEDYLCQGQEHPRKN